MARLAVVLFNLGGPDSLEAVKPFLINLFSDPNIIGAPQPVRWVLARTIARRRENEAQGIYAQIGGRSPLLPNTEAQARALEGALADQGEAKVFIAMRYWHPRAAECAQAVAAYRPDEILLLPLYPQFSTTTVKSSLADWAEAAAAAGLGGIKSRAICCYPEQPDFIAAHAELVRQAIQAAAPSGKPRVLFSAHGLPKKIVAKGDPYPGQIERSAAAVMAKLDGLPDHDWVVCYQSRVGPLEWIQPYTEDEIRRAGADKRPLVVVPIAFVSEHAETLVEIEHQYRDLAHESGCPAFIRVKALGTSTLFIKALAQLVRGRHDRPAVCSGDGRRLCPAEAVGCLMRA